MKKCLYETHLHTYPVSKCARAGVRESLEFYKSLGYAGVFITNHFIDGNIGCDKSLPYAEKVEFYFSDYEEGVRIGEEIGLPVFLGLEISYLGSDFLVYGLDKEWLLAHPELEDMKMSQKLAFLAEQGALIIHAHPFREAGYIDHIRLFPRHVEGVEVYNACRTDFENEMARLYAEKYGFIPFAASDHHQAPLQERFGGMESDTPICDEQDFMARVREREMLPFRYTKDEILQKKKG